MENDTTSTPTLGVAVAGEVVTELQTDGELLVEDELLVEEISIDGMCGVY